MNCSISLEFRASRAFANSGSSRPKFCAIWDRSERDRAISKRVCSPFVELGSGNSDAVCLIASNLDFKSSIFFGLASFAASKFFSNSDKLFCILARASTGSFVGSSEDGREADFVEPNFLISERNCSAISESFTKASSRAMCPFWNSAPRLCTESSAVSVGSK